MPAGTPFVGEGRRRVVQRLVAAFDGLQVGSSVWFHLEAPTGSGKTRIIQEFYRALARERQQSPAYWPNELVDEEPAGVRPFDAASFERVRKQVHPRSFVKPDGAVPEWLWWGFGCGDRHGVRLSSIAHDVGQLEEHGPHLVDALNQRSRMARSLRRRAGELSESVASEVAGVALGAAGLAIPGVGLLALLGKYAYSGVRTTREQRQRRQEQLLDAVADHSGVITDAVEIMELLGRSGVPTVLVVEDLHWADAYLTELLSRVHASSDTCVLLVTTSWPGHADGDDSAAAPLLRAHHHQRLTFGADEDDAIEPLSRDDRIALVNAVMPGVSHVVARMVAKRVSNPLAIQLIGSLRSLRVRLEDDREARTAVDELPSEVSELYRQAWEELDSGVQLGLGFASLAMPSAMESRAGLRDDRWNKLHIGEPVLSELVGLIRELTGEDSLDSDEGVEFGWSEELDKRLRQFADPAQAALARAFVHKQLSAAERADFQRRVAAMVTTLGLPTELDSEQHEHSIRLHLAAVSTGLVDAVPETYDAGARLLWRLFRSLGEQPEVEDLARLLDGIAADAQGDADQLRAIARLVLLQCAYSRGESEVVANELIQAQDLARDGEAPIRLGLGRLHGRVVRSLGQLNQAVEIFSHWLAVAERELPAEDRDCLALRNELAFTLGRIGRPAAAVEILRNLPRTGDPALADPHDQLRREHDFASLVRRQGRPAEAVGILTTVLDRQRALLGHFHPDTLATLQLIGAAQRDSGQLQRARATIEEVLAARIESLGMMHHDTLVARGHLVWLLRRRRRWDEALSLGHELLVERMKLFGPRHNTVVDASRVYGTLLMESGRFGEAEEVLLSVLVPSPIAAADDPSAVDTLTYLARLRRYQGQFEAAHEGLGLAARAGRDFESGHLSLQAIEFEHCRLHAAAGDVDAAIDRLRSLESSQATWLEDRHPERARTQVALAAALLRRGFADEAQAWVLRASATAAGTDQGHEIWQFITLPSAVLDAPTSA